MSSRQDFKGIVSLSEEQYTTLSTTGTLTVGDITLTYSPTDTIYVTPDTSSGVIQLVGTETNPINFATDMEVGQIYSCTGVIYNGASINNWILEEGYSFLIEKMNANRVVIFNAKLGSTNIEFDHTNNLLIVYSSDGTISSFSSAIFFNSVNGSSNDVNGIYAPTTSGTSGQVLISNGESQSPIWSDLNLPEQNVISLTGTQEDPIVLYDDIEVGKIYFLSGYIKVVQPATAYLLPDSKPTIMCVGLWSNNEKTIEVRGVQFLVDGIYSQSWNFIQTIVFHSSSSWGSNSYLSLNSINGTDTTASNLYAPTSSGTSGQFLQSNGTNNAPTWVDFNQGITTLVGTEDQPINFATSMEVGKLYSCTGYIQLTSANTQNISPNYILIYKRNNDNLTAYGVRINNSYISVNSIFVTSTILINDSGFITGWGSAIAPNTINGSPTSTSDIYAPTSSGNAGQILQSNGSGRKPTWIDASNGIQTLIGTEESPINLATSLSVGQLYSCQGVINAGANYSFTSLGETNDNFLLYKWSDTGIYALTCSSSNIDGVTHIFNGYQGICYIIIDTSGNITGVSNANFINLLNGNSNVEPGTPLSIYAPTTSGEAGQVLQSNGADQAPSWNSLSTTISESSTNNEIPSALAVYNLIQSSIVSALGGNY